MTWLLTVSKKMACLLYSLKHLLERIRLVPKHLGKEELQLVLQSRFVHKASCLFRKNFCSKIVNLSLLQLHLTTRPAPSLQELRFLLLWALQQSSRPMCQYPFTTTTFYLQLLQESQFLQLAAYLSISEPKQSLRRYLQASLAYRLNQLDSASLKRQ